MKKHLFIFFFIPVLFTSCTHYYYVPNTQNVPLFKEKKEYRLSGTLACGDESSSTEIQAAYSLTDHIGIMANFMSAKGGNISDNSDWAKGNYLDGAIGYFKPVRKYGVFEIYGGVGCSKQYHHYITPFSFNSASTSSSAGTADIFFTKVFVQPSFGFTTKPFDIIASTRICFLTFNNVDNKISGNLNESDALNKITYGSHLFLEPAITIRGGWKYVKLQLQASTASYLHNPDLHFETYHIGIGIYVAIARRYK